MAVELNIYLLSEVVLSNYVICILYLPSKITIVTPNLKLRAE
jgi:hypothetical protein